MIRATVRACAKEESESEARVIGANWFGCKPEEVTLEAVRTEAETEYVEHSNMATTMLVPTDTTYCTEYKIYGPGEYYDD